MRGVFVGGAVDGFSRWKGLDRRAVNLHHPSLRAERSNPDCGTVGLLRSARNDDSDVMQRVLVHKAVHIVRSCSARHTRLKPLSC
jgi:hypothetical protein